MFGSGTAATPLGPTEHQPLRLQPRRPANIPSSPTMKAARRCFSWTAPSTAQPMRQAPAPSGNGIQYRRGGRCAIRETRLTTAARSSSLTIPFADVRSCSRTSTIPARDSSKPGSSMPRGQPGTSVHYKTRRPRATTQQWPSTAGAALRSCSVATSTAPTVMKLGNTK